MPINYLSDILHLRLLELISIESHSQTNNFSPLLMDLRIKYRSLIVLVVLHSHFRNIDLFGYLASIYFSSINTVNF